MMKTTPMALKLIWFYFIFIELLKSQFVQVRLKLSKFHVHPSTVQLLMYHASIINIPQSSDLWKLGWKLDEFM